MISCACSRVAPRDARGRPATWLAVALLLFGLPEVVWAQASLTLSGHSIIACGDKSPPNQCFYDSDGKPGEALTGTASGSIPGATIDHYEWYDASTYPNTPLASTTVPTYAFSAADGAGRTLYVVLCSAPNPPGTASCLGLSSAHAIASVDYTVAPPNIAKIAAPASGQVFPDTDHLPGENVVLDATGSTQGDCGLPPDVPTCSPPTYQWTVNGKLTSSSTVKTTVRLPDGNNTISLVVLDAAQTSLATAAITVTVQPPASAAAPTAVIAGGNRTIPDTDGKPGEIVAMDGSGSTAVAPKTIISYIWSVNGTVVTSATGPKPSLALPDGTNTVSLVVVDSQEVQSARASVTITVLSPNALAIQIAGGDRAVSSTDGLPGARVPFSATATFNGQPVAPAAFQWTATALVNGQSVTVDSASGTAAPTLRLRDGLNRVTLNVTPPGGNTGTVSVAVTVNGTNAPGTSKPLSSIPGLTPNQLHVAQAIEQACNDLTSQYYANANLGSDVVDLLQQCRALIHDHVGAQNVPGLQVALDAISGQPITEMQRLGLDFADTQFKNLGNRLREVRSGQRGMSTSGLQIQGGNSTVPVQQLVQIVRDMLGGGAGDSPSESELLKDRLGFFITGNLRVGSRSESANESAFSARNDSITIGADYRIWDSFVLGGSFGYGHSDSTFAQPSARIDSRNRTFSLYGSFYRGDWYLDFIMSLGRLNYDSARHVTFVSSVITAPGGVVDRVATGSTHGHQTGVSASTGYDWHWGGLTAGPQLTLNYTRLRVDSFDETGASGLDLSYDEQNGKSLNAQAGVHLSYAINTRFGVLLPHLQAAGVHEFASGAQSVDAHFSADAAAQFELLTDAPDRNYVNYSAGVSAQFPYGIAGFVDYQSIAGLTRMSVHDISIGLRIATHF